MRILLEEGFGFKIKGGWESDRLFLVCEVDEGLFVVE